MGKKDTTPTTKQPKTIEVKLLVPYALLTLIVAAAIGFGYGWAMRSDQESVVKAQVNELLQVSKAQK